MTTLDTSLYTTSIGIWVAVVAVTCRQVEKKEEHDYKTLVSLHFNCWIFTIDCKMVCDFVLKGFDLGNGNQSDRLCVFGANIELNKY